MSAVTNNNNTTTEQYIADAEAAERSMMNSSRGIRVVTFAQMLQAFRNATAPKPPVATEEKKVFQFSKEA